MVDEHFFHVSSFAMQVQARGDSSVHAISCFGAMCARAHLAVEGGLHGTPAAHARSCSGNACAHACFAL
eukprot:scaffold15721_cov21-Tisochrysis_lutea.AAC.4